MAVAKSPKICTLLSNQPTTVLEIEDLIYTFGFDAFPQLPPTSPGPEMARSSSVVVRQPPLSAPSPSPAPPGVTVECRGGELQ